MKALPIIIKKMVRRLHKPPIMVYKGERKDNSWARYMASRTIRKNDNNLISVVGKTGSGKTYAGISIGQMISKLTKTDFTIDNVVFSLRELMELMNSGKLKRGSVIVFDEPQISISAKTFQAEANKVFTMLISTFRHLNFSLLFCTPYENLLDKSTRKLFHGTFTTMSINYNTQTCRLLPRQTEYGGESDKKYSKKLYLSFEVSPGRRKTVPIDFWDVPKPTQDFIKLYEIKKKKFTSNLNKNIYQRLIKYDESGKSMTAPHKVEVEPDRKPLTETQLEVMKTLAKYNDSETTLKDTARERGVAISAIHKSKALAMKKGYCVEEFL